MSESTSGSLSRKREEQTDIVAESRAAREARTGRRTATVPVSEKFKSISKNTVFQIITDASLTPEQKKEKLAASIVADPSNIEASRARLEEWAVFKEFMQARRIELNEQILATADTNAFADLQSVIKELNEGLIQFQDTMKPLTEILDAVYELRQAGKTLEIVREIGNDKAWEEGIQAQIGEVQSKVNAANENISSLQSTIDSEKGRKKYFFFGGPKNPDLIANLEGQVAGKETEIQGFAEDAQDLKTQLENGPGSDHPDLIRQKRVLAQMLNLSSDEHRERHASLISAARQYIDFSKEKTAKALENFQTMGGQIKSSADTTGEMVTVYATMDEAVKIAEARNIELRSEFVAAAEGESELEKLERTKKLGVVDDFVSAVVDTKVDTARSIQDLSQERMRVQTMGKQNEQNIQGARNLSTSGVAAVAGQLTMVVNSVGSAALYHSQEAAKETMRRMTEFNNDVLGKESIGVAMRVEDTNNDLLRALEDVAAFAEVANEAKLITEVNTKELLGNLDAAVEGARGLHEELDASRSVTAEAQAAHLEGGNADGKSSAAGKPARKADSSFGNLFGGTGPK